MESGQYSLEEEEDDDILSSLMIEVDDDENNKGTRRARQSKESNIQESEPTEPLSSSHTFPPSFPSPMLTSTEKFALHRWINTINLVLQVTRFLPRQMIMEEEEAMIMHNIKILLHAMKKEKDPYSLLDPGLRPPLSTYSPTNSQAFSNRRENASNKITVPARFLSITQVACLCILELSQRKEELSEYRNALQNIAN